MKFLTFLLVFGLTFTLINTQSAVDNNICDLLSNILPGYLTSQPKIAEFLYNFKTTCKNTLETFLRIPRAVADVNSCELMNATISQLPDQIKSLDVVQSLIGFLIDTCDNLPMLEAFMKQFFEDQIKDVCEGFLAEEINALYGAINALNVSKSVLELQNENFMKKIESLEKENENLKSNSNTDELEKCKENSKKLVTENSELKSKVSDLTKKVDDLTDELDDFRNPVNGTCRFKIVSDFGYSCVGNKITINSAATQKVSWTGSHLNKYSNSKVKALIIRSQSTQFLPLEVGKTFGNLESFAVETSKLQNLKKNDFKTLENLKKLILTGNEISAIDGGTFDILTKLTYLNLRNNKIANLPSRAFEKLTALTHLDLGENKLTQLKYDLIPAENEIEHFYADKNDVKKFDILFVWRLSNANYIDFSGTTCGRIFDRSVQPSFGEFFADISANCQG